MSAFAIYLGNFRNTDTVFVCPIIRASHSASHAIWLA